MSLRKLKTLSLRSRFSNPLGTAHKRKRAKKPPSCLYLPTAFYNLFPFHKLANDP